MTTTPLMSLDLPVVGVTPTPQWANQIVAALTAVDSHDHSSGSGARITPAGLDINADLDVQSKTLKAVGSMRYSSLLSVLASTSVKNATYVVNGELYYNDSNGTPVRITNNGSLDGSSLGAITGLVSPQG